MSNTSLPSRQEERLLRVYQSATLPKTPNDILNYIKRSSGEANELADLVDRNWGERLHVIRSYDERLEKLLVSAILGALQSILSSLKGNTLSMFIEALRTHYSDLCISDLRVFCKEMMMAKYGKQFGEPSVQYLMDCFQQFYEERALVLEDHRIRRHEKLKETFEKGILNDEQLREMYRRGKIVIAGAPTQKVKVLNQDFINSLKSSDEN